MRSFLTCACSWTCTCTCTCTCCCTWYFTCTCVRYCCVCGIVRVLIRALLILFILILFTGKLFAQTETDCPFKPRKYVHYDGVIQSLNTTIPMNYSQLIQNNNSYSRGNAFLEQPAQAKCFYKSRKVIQTFIFQEQSSWGGVCIEDCSHPFSFKVQ